MGIGSVTSSNEAYLQSLLLEKTKAAASAETESDGTDSVSSAASAVQTAKYDTFELSGGSAADSTQTAVSGVQDSIELSEQALQYLKAQNIAATEETEASEETTASENLSTYTEEQLEEMVENGEITKMEYNAEISRRKAEEKQPQAPEEENPEGTMVVE